MDKMSLGFRAHRGQDIDRISGAGMTSVVKPLDIFLDKFDRTRLDPYDFERFLAHSRGMWRKNFFERGIVLSFVRCGLALSTDISHLCFSRLDFTVKLIVMSSSNFSESPEFRRTMNFIRQSAENFRAYSWFWIFLSSIPSSPSQPPPPVINFFWRRKQQCIPW